MFSPLAELDTVEPAVAALGWRSIALWRDIAAALPQRPMFRSEGSLMLAHREDLGAAQRGYGRMDYVSTHLSRRPMQQETRYNAGDLILPFSRRSFPTTVSDHKVYVPEYRMLL